MSISHAQRTLRYCLGVCIVGAIFTVVHADRGPQPTEITVYPSGDLTGRIDADNIEAALESVASGGTVLLEPGEFFTSRPIVVKGFNGVLRGYGVDATSIEAVKTSKGNHEPTFGSVRVDWFDDVRPEWRHRHTMFYFEDPVVNLTVSNLTLKVIDWYPVWRCEWCDAQLDALILVTMAEDVDTHFDQIRLRGVWLHGQGNLYMGIRLLGGESATLAYAGPQNWPTGNHSLTSSEIAVQGFWANYGYALTFARDSQLTFSNNVVSSVIPIRLLDLDNSNVLVTSNTLTSEGMVARLDYRDATGLLMIQWRTQMPTNLLVEDNQFRSIGEVSPVTYAWGIGLELIDRSEHPPTLRAVFQDNDFHFSDTALALPEVGIWGHGATEGVTVRHNAFHGTGWLGVAGGWSAPSDIGWVLHGNNFTGMEAGSCHVCLGPQSQNWTVVGGGSSISVRNLGVNNSIVGVTDLRDRPPGPPLSEALRESRDLEKLYH